MVAFSSPYDKDHEQSHGVLKFIIQNYSPKDYVPIFKKIGVKAVVRLNNITYNAQ